jgi:predicted lipoprotein with Yx(FWY)xxD motif
MKIRNLVSMMFLGLLSSVAFAASGPTTSVVVNGHEILANRNQLTAYVFDNDKNGVSSCYNGCASAWPAILVQPGDEIVAPFGTTTRKDGTQQVTFQGRPIYLYADDQKPGDVEGDGLGGVWHIVDLN